MDIQVAMSLLTEFFFDMFEAICCTRKVHCFNNFKVSKKKNRILCISLLMEF